MIKSFRIFAVPIIMALLVLTLVGCGDDNSAGKTYTVNWEVNGIIIETDTNVLEGSQPDYNGQSPTRESDDNYDYTFNGWATSENNNTGTPESLLPLVTADVIYHAIFSKEQVTLETKYTITWKDSDGTILTTTRVNENSLPSRELPNDTAEWDYTGWTPTIVSATSDTIYTAVREKQVYLITWKDASGAIIDTDEVQYGVIPIAPQLPSHNDTSEWKYSDSAWDKSILAVTGATVYQEVINREKQVYTITWKDVDGTTISTTQVAYGQTPSHTLPEDTETWDYTMWSPSIATVTGDTTYTAVREAKIYIINNKVLVDNEYLKITIVSVHEDILFGFYLDVYYENKTTDKELMFSLQDVVVNGYVISSFWIDSLEAGTNATDEIWISLSHMEQSGITTADKIELYIRVYDNDDWFSDDLLNQKFTVYPTGLSDGEVVSPDRPSNNDEFVLIDNDEISLIIIDTYDDSIWGYTMLAYIENKTLDKEIMFSLQEVVVNGYRINSLWASSLPAGTKTVTTIELSSSDMERSGITTVDKVELYVRVYDYNNWFDDDLINTKYTIYPTGLSENEIISPTRPTSGSEYIVVQNDHVVFIVVDTYMDPIWGYTLKVYIENKSTSKELMFSWDDVLVNGIEIDPYWATSIMPGSKAVVTISFYKSDLEENNIVTIESVEFLLTIYDSNDWFADYLVEDTFEYFPTN